jgi:hypothetical protein
MRNTDNAGPVPALSFGGLQMNSFRAVLSPCIGVCSLDDDGYCSGCHRTGAEIARWSQMGDDERLRLMEAVLPVREARRQA